MTFTMMMIKVLIGNHFGYTYRSRQIPPIDISGITFGLTALPGTHTSISGAHVDVQLVQPSG